MATIKQIQQGPTAIPEIHKSSKAIAGESYDPHVPDAMRFEREDFYRLWCLYLDWRMSVSSTGQENSGDGVRANAISEIKSAARNLIAPHWPFLPQVSFLIALMCSTADTASRFSRADREENGCYAELAFEMFWNGLVNLKKEHESWEH